MAYEQTHIEDSWPVAADLSGDQFRFVEVTATGEVDIPAAQGNPAIGVLADNDGDAAGKETSVTIFGTTKVRAGAAISAGDIITCDTSGDAITASATEYGLGFARAAASAADEIIPVFLVNLGVQ